MDISFSSLSLEDVPIPNKTTTSQSIELIGEAKGSAIPEEEISESQQPEPATLSENPVDFLALVALALQHNVPQVDLDPSTGDLPREGQRHGQYVSYSLGEGVSSFLERHVFRSETSVGGRRYRLGDVVALKRNIVLEYNDNIGVSQQQYNWIAHELQILCHPGLRRHENICELLFIGFEEYSPALVLGLEMAEYGNLKDFIFAENLSDFENMDIHLVIDIAMGLKALHDANFVHGDMKTGNILVFEHPNRKVVAKLSDFSDSICVTESRWTPVGGTHSWRAPECYGDSEYDRLATDVYSFALVSLAVLAQGIWVSQVNDTGIGDCFLTRLPQLKGMAKEEIINHLIDWKRQDGLVLDLATCWTETCGNSKLAGHMAKKVAVMALQSDPKARRDISYITWDVLESLSLAGEPSRYQELISERSNHSDDQHNELEESKNEFESLRVPTIGDEALRGHHPFFKRRILEALKNVSGPALKLTFPPLPAITEHTTNLTNAFLLSSLHKASIPILNENESEYLTARALNAAAQLGECYAVGFGADQDLLEAAKWLSISARAGHLDHMIYSLTIYEHLGCAVDHFPDKNTREFWLVTAVAGHSSEMGKILRKENRALYEVAKVVADQSGGILRMSRDPRTSIQRIGVKLEVEDLPLDYKFLPMGYTILHYAVAYGHYEAVEELLKEGADPNVVDFMDYTPLIVAASGGKSSIMKLLLDNGANPRPSERVVRMTPVHLLAYCNEDDVVDLAKSMVKDSSQLTKVSGFRGKIGLENPWIALTGSPLRWAALQGSEALFTCLLDLHLQFETSSPDLPDILENLASDHQAYMLQRILPHVPKLMDSKMRFQSEDLDRLLLICAAKVVDIGLLMLHGNQQQKARISTINALLSAGANPLRLPEDASRKTFLQNIMIQDDIEGLHIFVDWARSKKIDVKASLNNAIYFGGRDAFQRSIYCGSWHVFKYLADSEYVNKEFTSDRGMTALHAAAVLDETRYIDVLIKIGFDPYARSSDGRTPFQSALFFRNFKTASRLLESDACKPTALFSTPNEKGFLLSGSVIGAALTNYRHIVDMKTFKYLESVGAFLFANNTELDTTVLEMMAQMWPALRPDYRAFDRALLEWSLSRISSNIINRHDHWGFTPLHWMVIRGNSDCISVMVQNPLCDVNVESRDAVPGSNSPISVPGKTALTIAYERRHTVPDHVRRGGQRELRQWGLRTEEIIKLLKDAGGKLGSNTRMEQALEAADIPNVSVVYPGEGMLTKLLGAIQGPSVRIEEVAHTGAWPKRLGSRPKT